MSAVIVVTPLIIGSWPVIAATVTAALGTLGYSVAQGNVRQKGQLRNRAEIEVEQSEILEDAGGTGEELVVERAGLRAVFSHDARGGLRVCVEGDGLTKAELRRVGQELIDRVTQQYVYHKLMTELNDRNLQVVDEEVAADRTIHIRVRNW